MSLGVNPITAQPHAKKPLTKGQKAAAITGAVVATAATAATIAAGVIGGKKTPNAKLLAKIGTGFGEMGSFIAKSATSAGEIVSKKAKAAGEWVSKKADNAGKAIKEAFENITSKFHKTAQEVTENIEENLPVGHA